MNSVGVAIAYIGPETIVPLTSCLAAVGGALMMGWGSVCRACAWCVRKLKRTST